MVAYCHFSHWLVTATTILRYVTQDHLKSPVPCRSHMQNPRKWASICVSIDYQQLSCSILFLPVLVCCTHNESKVTHEIYTVYYIAMTAMMYHIIPLLEGTSLISMIHQLWNHRNVYTWLLHAPKITLPLPLLWFIFWASFHITSRNLAIAALDFYLLYISDSYHIVFGYVFFCFSPPSLGLDSKKHDP